MVTGGFKVWHIIFIIIAFIVTMIVIYCCFHRCRIPRTKQEIEADLMRSNLGNKFRDYLQELPNEPFTFSEALKKVQEIEEKLEADDAQLSRELGARKRMGWIKLKGKEKETDKADKHNKDDKDDKQQQKEADEPAEPSKANGAPSTEAALSLAATKQPATELNANQPPIVAADLPSDGQLKPPEVTPEEASKKEINKQQPPREGEQDNDNSAGDATLRAQTKAQPPAPKRRRQKPNLSRTKLAKERPPMVEPSVDVIEPERPTAERTALLELPEPSSRRQRDPSRAQKKKVKSSSVRDGVDAKEG